MSHKSSSGMYVTQQVPNSSVPWVSAMYAFEGTRSATVLRELLEILAVLQADQGELPERLKIKINIVKNKDDIGKGLILRDGKVNFSEKTFSTRYTYCEQSEQYTLLVSGGFLFLFLYSHRR